MTNLVKGLNTGIILHEDRFLALCFKVRKMDDVDECFYFQAPMLRDLLLILTSRLSIISHRKVGGPQAVVTFTEEANRLMSHIPVIDAEEVERPDNQRRIASAMVKPNVDNCVIHLIQQNEKISSLNILDTQVEFILQAIMQVLNITNSPELVHILTSTLDFLMLYDAKFGNNGNIQCSQYSQAPWKQNFFTHHINLIYIFKVENSEDIYYGATIKTNALPGTPEIKNIVQQLIMSHEGLKAYQNTPFQIYSDILPSLTGIILTKEECLRPLNDFRLKIMESIKE